MAEIVADMDEPPIEHIEIDPNAKPWYPALNKTQLEIFNDPNKFILAHGEKGSGKSIGCLHKLIRHCYEEHNAFALIIAPSIRTGADGVVHDLENLILPAWQEGNRFPPFIAKDGALIPHPHAGELMDSGIGLKYIPFKAEFDTKDRVMWVQNRHGTWSKIKLISIPYAEAIEPRIKGPAPSLIYVEEITDLDDPAYFTFPAAQLGRRRSIVGPQQYIASCNPKGPTHWVYERFFVLPIDPETGEKDKDYSVYHVPVMENICRLPAGYIEGLKKIFKGNPIQARRLLDGEWIDVPSGESLFKDQFDQNRHVVGDIKMGTGLTPIPGFRAMIAMDLGQVNSAAIFLQAIPTESGLTWIVFDEIVHIRKRILYRNMAREIAERMAFWDDGNPFTWEIVADSSAVNQWRPGDGNYDAAIFERVLNDALAIRERQPIRVQGCPKGPGSVEARVRLTQDLLAQNQLHISAQCPKTVEAILMLVGDKKNPMHPMKQAAGYDHTFDALSYGLFKVLIGGGRQVSPDESQVVALQLL